MPKSVWQCSKCGSVYDEETKAQTCENEHRDPSTFKITGCGYAKSDHLYGPSITHTRIFPETLTVRFSDAPHDFGSYKLVRVGPKGM